MRKRSLLSRCPTYIAYIDALSKPQEFEFLTAVLANIARSTYMAQCVLAYKCKGFGGAYYHHLQGGKKCRALI